MRRARSRWLQRIAPILMNRAPWYLAGGIPAANCIAAYRPVGALSLAQSYANLVSPGTDDAQVGVAPTLDAGWGWKFNGTTQYLTTLAPTAIAQTIICAFAKPTVSATLRAIFGAYEDASKNLIAIPVASATTHNYYSYAASALAKSTAITDGVFAIANKTCYLNGNSEGSPLAGGSALTVPTIYIGGEVYTAALFYPWDGYIMAFAKYNTTLTQAQIRAVTLALMPRNLVADGDSIPRGHDGLTPYGRTAANNLGAPFQSYCTNSETLVQMEANAATTVDLHIIPGASNVLIVHGGTNDIKAGADGATTYSRLVTYCTARRAAGWKILVVGCIPRIESGFTEAARDDYNAAIRAGWSAIAEAFVDVDTNAAFDEEADANNLTYYQADKIHPNQTGQDLLSTMVQAGLAGLL